METLRGRVVGVQRAEGSRDELWGQRVENVGLLELQCLQLGLDLLEGDAVQAGVLVADGDEVLPKLPGTARMRERGTESRIFNECHFSVFSVGFYTGAEFTCSGLRNRAQWGLPPQPPVTGSG